MTPNTPTSRQCCSSALEPVAKLQSALVRRVPLGGLVNAGATTHYVPCPRPRYAARCRCYLGRPKSVVVLARHINKWRRTRTCQRFLAGSFWRYAASLAGSVEICRSAYY
jgi:hypothetical protein